MGLIHQGFANTDILCFLKVGCYVTSLLWSICTSTCSMLTKKSKRFMLLPKKKAGGGKWKQPSAFVFQGIVIEGVGTPSRESSTTKFLYWKLHSASQQQTARALNYVCEHLCFIWIYFVHPLPRMCPKGIVFSRYTILSYERLWRKAPLLDIRGIL